MKITDEGIKVLSLSREPLFNEQLNSYLIYEWKGIEYFASLKEPENLNQNQVFIELSNEQFKSISSSSSINTTGVKPSKAPVTTNQMNENSSPEEENPFESSIHTSGTNNLSILSQITSEFETALLLKIDDEEKTLYLEDFFGENRPKEESFNISLEHKSPFKIVVETKKPFHGIYAETIDFNKNLYQCGVNPENLWVTAHPLIAKGKLLGLLVGLSNNRNYSLDELEIFERLHDFAAEILTLKLEEIAKAKAA